MSTYVINPTVEQEKVVRAFLEALDVPFAKEEECELPQYVLDGIERSRKDFEAGRFISFEEFKKKYPAG